MPLVQSYPAEVIAINGSSTGPWQPAPASTFRYTVNVTMGDRQRVFENVKPNKERWPEFMNVNPIAIGTLVTVYVIGTVCVMDSRELPHAESCPGGDSLLSNPGDLLRTVQAMTREQRRLLRSLLEL